MDYQKYTDLAIEFIKQYAPNVVIALLILVIGLWLTKKVVRISQKIMASRGVDETL